MAFGNQGIISFWEEQAHVIHIRTGAALMHCYSFRFSIYRFLFQVLYIILFMI
jgi:hypothetical protein